MAPTKLYLKNKAARQEVKAKTMSGVRKPMDKTPCSTFAKEVVTVRVGPHNIGFIVHKDVLVKNSDYMKATMSKPWAGIVSINDHDPVVFNIYVQYLYTGKIFSMSSITAPPTPHLGTTVISEEDEWALLIDLYRLGDYLLDFKFINTIADAMVEKWRADHQFPIGYAAKVYEGSVSGCPLRKLIVDFHVHLGLGKHIDHGSLDTGEGTAEFVIDLVREFYASKGAIWEKDAVEPWDTDPCRYHVHSGKCLTGFCRYRDHLATSSKL
ncbi:BTB/POZ domain-containing protein 19 [Elsinoe australis]|uniref:BTB/POZ domain-containing protein 19 n=1 Tax=Elsinoe australis TaxID=40998 RepID=A0A4U7AZG4_9PEZI|nr:BTB/POZ domain-containing protein 19 [Elsinoe australis]